MVLTGDGDAFCAGLDLSVLAGTARQGTDPRRAKARAKGICDRVFDISRDAYRDSNYVTKAEGRASAIPWHMPSAPPD